MLDIRPKRRQKTQRRGITSVEVAFALPVLFLVFFGHLEFSRAHMLWQSVHTAAYEGARRGIVPGASTQDVRDAASLVLESVGANEPTVVVTPSVIDASTTDVTVSVSVSMNDNSWVIPTFFRDKSVTGAITLKREWNDEYSSL